jgi:hypothetical protein
MLAWWWAWCEGAQQSHKPRLRCRAINKAPSGERRPLERLANLFHNIFCHADFTSSDVAVTLYLAAMLQRIERRQKIASLLEQTPGARPQQLLQARTTTPLPPARPAAVAKVPQCMRPPATS